MTTANDQKILTEEMIEEIKDFFPHYPTLQAVTLPALHIVNERLRYVPIKAVVEIAELLELAPSQVQDTLTFYGFFKQDKPHGRTRAWICRSISCSLRGADEILAHVCNKNGVKPGVASTDGRVTIEFAECLGACEHAPCMLAGETLHKSLTIEKAEKLIDSFK